MSQPQTLPAHAERNDSADGRASRAIGISDVERAEYVARATKMASIWAGVADAYRRDDPDDLAKCWEMLARVEG